MVFTAIRLYLSRRYKTVKRQANSVTKVTLPSSIRVFFNHFPNLGSMSGHLCRWWWLVWKVYKIMVMSYHLGCLHSLVSCRTGTINMVYMILWFSTYLTWYLFYYTLSYFLAWTWTLVLSTPKTKCRTVLVMLCRQLHP